MAGLTYADQDGDTDIVDDDGVSLRVDEDGNFMGVGGVVGPPAEGEPKPLFLLLQLMLH